MMRYPVLWRLLCLLLAVLPAAWVARPTHAQTNARLVLAFYYAWYDPSSFGPGKTPFQPLHPYFSTDAATLRRHIATARAAGIDGFIQSWYGPNPNQQTEPNLAALLNLAQESGFRVAVHFEVASPFFSSNQDRIDALKALIYTHGRHPAYLKVGGKPVIFFWANWALPVRDWREMRAQADPWGNAIWIAEGGQAAYLEVFDGMHLYNVAWSGNPGGVNANIAGRTREAAQTYGAYKYWAATAMPGFDNSLVSGVEHTVRGRGNGAYLRDSFRGAAATNPDFLLVTSFNEWREGSGIEPSKEFGNQYVTLLGQLAAEYKGFDAATLPPLPNWPAPAPTAAPPPPTPTPTPLPTAAPPLLLNTQGQSGISDGPPPTPAPPTAAPPVLAPPAAAPPTAAPPVAAPPTVAPAAAVAQVNPKASPTPLPNGDIIYEVQAGDTLTGIAARFGLSVDALATLNGLTADSVLGIGLRLYLRRVAPAYPAPAPPSAPQPTAVAEPQLPATTPTPALPTPGPDGRILYTARAGDSFLGIATRFGLAVSDLYALNGLTAEAVLREGQTLVLGVSGAPGREALPERFRGAALRESDGAYVHRVVAGDTLFGIAAAYGYTTIDAFYEVSGLSGGVLLQIGQEVVVGRRPQPIEQGGSTDLPTATHTPTPAPTATATLVPVPTVTPTPRNTLPPPPVLPTAVAAAPAELPPPLPAPDPPAELTPAERQGFRLAFLGLFGSLVVLTGLVGYLWLGRRR